MESYLTAVGIGSFDLIVGGIRFTGIGYGPHGVFCYSEAGILCVIDPSHRDNGSNFRTFIQRSGNGEAPSAVFRVDGGNIFSITADPGILFVVLNPDIREGQRIFWKAMSKSFLSDIDFEKESKIIKFSPEDEIKNTDESIELFCEKLNGIIDTHLFLNKLNSDDLEQEDALNIIEYQCNEISCFIEDLHDSPQYRDEVSRRIVRDLNDLCYATLILNAYKNGYTNVSEKLAWQVSQLRVDNNRSL